MTRINLGVHPSELPTKLLLAEHREIIRIPNAITSKRAKIVDIPAHFTLGKGHVKYFYDKIGSLYERYTQIRKECIKRQLNVSNYVGSFSGIPAELYGYISRQEIARARPIIIERIQSKGFKLIPNISEAMKIVFIKPMAEIRRPVIHSPESDYQHICGAKLQKTQHFRSTK